MKGIIVSVRRKVRCRLDIEVTASVGVFIHYFCHKSCCCESEPSDDSEITCALSSDPTAESVELPTVAEIVAFTSESSFSPVTCFLICGQGIV